MRNFWQFKNMDDSNAELYLYGEIVSEEPWFSEDCVSYRNFVRDLKALGDCKSITVYINSGGGDVFAANAVYSQLKKHSAGINIEIEGICASAATIIAMAGDVIRAEKNSLIMIHNPSVGLMGYFDADKLSKCQNSISAVKKSIIEAYLSRINKTEDELSELMDNETWYTGKEALEEGIIDEVYENSENSNFLNFADDRFAVINNFICDTERFKNFPKEKIKENKRYKEKALKEPFFNTKKETKEVISMTLMEVKDKYPDIYKENGKEAALMERERIKAIDEIAVSLPKEMADKAKYEDCISAAELAFNALRENKGIAASTFRDIVSDNSKSGVEDIEANDSLSEGGNGKEERIKRLADFMNKGGGR